MKKINQFTKFVILLVTIFLAFVSLAFTYGSLSDQRDFSISSREIERLNSPIYIAGTSKPVFAINERFKQKGIDTVYSERLNSTTAEQFDAVVLDDIWIKRDDQEVRHKVDALALEGKLIVVVGDLSKYAFDDLVNKLSVDPRSDIIYSFDKQTVMRNPNITRAVYALKVYLNGQSDARAPVGRIALKGKIADFSIEILSDYILGVIKKYGI